GKPGAAVAGHKRMVDDAAADADGKPGQHDDDEDVQEGLNAPEQAFQRQQLRQPVLQPFRHGTFTLADQIPCRATDSCRKGWEPSPPGQAGVAGKSPCKLRGDAQGGRYHYSFAAHSAAPIAAFTSSRRACATSTGFGAWRTAEMTATPFAPAAITGAARPGP